MLYSILVLLVDVYLVLGLSLFFYFQKIERVATNGK
jgi:hypothetical protein